MIPAEVYASFLAGYNQAVFPIHALFYALGIGAVLLVFVKPGRLADAVAKAVLAVFWAWLGVVYFWTHYGSINSAGYTWGVIFVLQAVLFAVEIPFAEERVIWSPRIFKWEPFKIILGGIQFRPFKQPALGHIGAAVAGWAFIGYPVSALLLHRAWPELALFGAATPVVIYTLGLLLFTFHDVPKWRAAFFPFLWSLVGGLGAATEWRYYEDYALFIAGIVFLGYWIWANNKYKAHKK